MVTVTLSNRFHSTTVRVQVPESEAHDAWGWLQREVYGVVNPNPSAVRKLRRVRRELCGMPGCTCGVVR